MGNLPIFTVRESPREPSGFYGGIPEVPREDRESPSSRHPAESEISFMPLRLPLSLRVGALISRHSPSGDLRVGRIPHVENGALIRHLFDSERLPDRSFTVVVTDWLLGLVWLWHPHGHPEEAVVRLAPRPRDMLNHVREKPTFIPSHLWDSPFEG